jgi:hypothetical protein
MGLDTEEDVIYALSVVQSIVPFPLSLNLWYRECEVDALMLCQFKKSNCKLIGDFNIQFFHLNSFEYYAWYDIIRKCDENTMTKFYFRFVYEVPSDLPVKLIEFKNFISSYGNKNEKHCYDGVNKLARQS